MTAARCPTCKSTSSRTANKVFPFCSPRCHMVDLGRWLAEDYRVPAEPADAAPAPASPDDDR